MSLEEFSYAFDIADDETTKSLDDRFFRLIDSDLTSENYYIGYGLGATELICNILYRYKDYFVIFIGEPHPNPNKAVPQFGMQYVKLKHTDELKHYRLPNDTKNVLIYFTSTCYQTGEIHDLDSVISFIDELKRNGINVVSVNDAVQQLFFMKSKYNSFDYIIYTAHSIIGRFNMGVCIQRKSKLASIGDRWYTDPKNHILALEKRLPFKGISEFKPHIYKIFEREIKEGRLNPLENTASHFFVAEIKQNPNIIEHFFNSKVMERYDNKYYFKLRFQNFKNLNKNVINTVKNILHYDFIDS